MTTIPPKRNKYRAVKISIDGRVFHSKREGAHYVELRLRERAGEIEGLECQVPIQLYAYSHDEGTAIPVFKYVLDFKYFDRVLDRWMFVDVKGMETALFRMKRKMFEACTGKTLTLVR